MKRAGWWPIAVGLVIGGLGIAFGGWWAAGRPIPAFFAHHFKMKQRLSPAAAEVPPLKVQAVRASQQNVPLSFEYTSTIVSPADAELQARISGQVIERAFEPGGLVKRGQVLFRIDPRPFEVALQSAEAQRDQARASLDFAILEVGRTEGLAERGIAPQQRLQQLQSNRATAEARLKETEATIARDRLNINYSVIRAPFDGRASLSNINIGDTVIENQTNLVSVVQVNPIDVQVALSSADADAVRDALPRDQARIELLDEQRKVVRDATIYRLDNRFDPRTARRLVQAKVDNRDERFLPGQFVRVRVLAGREERLFVPSIALSAQLDQQIVWTVNDKGLVQMTPIETGDVYGDTTAVTKGLKPGATVVVDHLQSMRQNLKVAAEIGDVPSLNDVRAQSEARE